MWCGIGAGIMILYSKLNFFFTQESSLTQSLTELIAIGAGIAIMVGITLYE